MIILLLCTSICLLAPVSLAGDESCTTECFTDKMPLCGTWLLKEDNADVAGTYDLNKGLVNMTCLFSSLPEPATVSWMHKAPNANKWQNFACSSKEENKLCTDTEHRVDSRCLLRTTSLEMSGSYRCVASTKGHANENNNAIGSEFAVNVVGISKTEVTGHSLKYGKMGHIDVEVCANPKPEIFWITPEAIIRSHEGIPRMSATHLHHKKSRSSPDGPAAIVPYCYTAQLLINEVRANDTFRLMVRTEGASANIPLSLPVLGVPIASASLSPLLVSSGVLLYRLIAL